MSLESDFFLKKLVNFALLEPYGFRLKEGAYHYSAAIMEGQFRAAITITAEGAVSGRLFDLESGAEYSALHVERASGAFVHSVREAYLALLADISTKCFTDSQFIYEQTNRLAVWIKETFGETPDNPFQKAEAAVFRHAANRKWYGLIMAIPRSRLTQASAGQSEAENAADKTPVEIINLKAAPESIAKLTKIPGIYPCYHMNKKNWVSVLLDGTVPDDLIKELLLKSRELSAGKAPKAPGSRAENYWLVPANPAFYDVEGVFDREKITSWKQSARLKPGDIVYMYVAAPISAILYKCEVLKTDIPYHYEDENLRLKKIMELKVLLKYPYDFMPIKRMRTLGVAMARGQQMAPKELVAALEIPPETLTMMDSAVANLKNGEVSEPVDLNNKFSGCKKID